MKKFTEAMNNTESDSDGFLIAIISYFINLFLVYGVGSYLALYLYDNTLKSLFEVRLDIYDFMAMQLMIMLLCSNYITASMQNYVSLRVGVTMPISFAVIYKIVYYTFVGLSILLLLWIS